MRIAIQGCGHGDLNAIYAKLAQLCGGAGLPDALIVCGDFQAIRNGSDLVTMACPPRYRQMGDFCEYYTGRRVAPLLTLFIGGNHEASAHMAELYHGGWVAPNIYFLGYANVVRLGELRIGAISGLHHERDYERGYWESPPYTESSIRSIYHTRAFDVRRLSLLREPLDWFISHEWPLGIYDYGDRARLLRTKPHFRTDIEPGGQGIGAAPLRALLEQLRPRKWYAAHMHVEFKASFPHQDGNATEFHALDKCLPHRHHLSIVEVPPTVASADPTANRSSYQLTYDREWLAIVRAMNPLMSFQFNPRPTPSVDEACLSEHRKFIDENLSAADLVIPRRHERPAHLPGRHTTWMQTADFCRLLQMTNHWGEGEGRGNSAEAKRCE